jgi:hypothetical protein
LHNVYIGTPEWVVSRTWVVQPGRCMREIERRYGRKGLILGVLEGDDSKAEEIRKAFGASWEWDPLGSVPITPGFLPEFGL